MRLLASTFATSPTGEKIFLAAGTEAPEWAHGVITNPAVLPQTVTVEQDGREAEAAAADEDTPAEDTAHADDDTSELRAALKEKTVDQLRDLASEQGLSTGGKKADLVDRLLG